MTSVGSLYPAQRVSIVGKGIGTIAFIGKTDFAEGKTRSFNTIVVSHLFD
jgi:hypothetical protein